MSSSTQTRPVITLYSSPQEHVNAYMAAIRLASSVRNSMDAQKAGVDAGKIAPLADSYGRHHPNFPPQPSTKSATPGGREADLIVNHTASAHFAPNTTKPGFVHSQDGNLSRSHSMSTGTWPLVERHPSPAAADPFTLAITPTGAILENLKRHQGYFPPPDPPKNTGDDLFLEDTAADAPTGVNLETLKRHQGHFPPPDPPVITSDGPIPVANTPTRVKPETLEQHHGYFPPPEPPIDSTQGSRRIRRHPLPPPGKPGSSGSDPIAIEANHDHMLVLNHLPPNGIPPECQLYVTNTDLNNTFAVCPVTNRTTDPTHNLASHQIHTRGIFNSHVLAIRDTAMCEAPTGFDERLACGQLDKWFVLAFFVLFAIIGLAWMTRRISGTLQLDEEKGTDTWPRPKNVSTDSLRAKRKPRAAKTSTTNSSEAKLREKLRKARKEDQRLKEGLSTASKSVSYRAERAHEGARVEHDAGPVAGLPNLDAEPPAYAIFELA